MDHHPLIGVVIAVDKEDGGIVVGLSEIASCASCAAMTYPMKIQPCAFWMEAIVDHLEAHRFLQ